MDEFLSLSRQLLSLPELASVHGEDVDKFIVYIHILMGVLFVGWFLFFIYTLFRFRQKKNTKANYHGVKSHASSYLEVAVALVEAVLLIGFAIPMWAKVVEDFPANEESTVIQVVAQQFAWNANYPGPDGVLGAQDPKYFSSDNPFGTDPNDPAGADDFSTFNEIVVPVDKPVIVELTSMDVIHSFKLYNMRVNQDAIPGLMVPVHFIPTKTGEYQVVCAQLCGSSHAYMRGYFNVVKQTDYDTWVQTKTAEAAATAGGFE